MVPVGAIFLLRCDKFLTTNNTARAHCSQTIAGHGDGSIPLRTAADAAMLSAHEAGAFSPTPSRR
jgi:hypothetical protein